MCPYGEMEISLLAGIRFDGLPGNGEACGVTEPAPLAVTKLFLPELHDLGH